MMVVFPHYTYPAALPLLGVAVKLGMFPMPGVGEVPKEGMAALQSELTNAGDVEQYARKEYGAVSLGDAVRKLCGCSRGLTRPPGVGASRRETTASPLGRPRTISC
jgi:hypothetical protein